MNRAEDMMLSLVRSAVNETSPESVSSLSEEESEAVFSLAERHALLPLVLDAACSDKSYRIHREEKKKRFTEIALKTALRQIIQTNEFLTLLLRAQERGFDPAVMKGVICRSLYPKPMLRPSVDEDVIIPSSQLEEFHAFLLEQGLFADDPEADIKTAFELSYHKENSPTYIEVHTKPFPPDSEAYGDLNALFEGVLERTIRVQIEDVSVRTLAPEDHLLYILCHAYKHFLHGGVGLRQVCDIAMMTRAYMAQIDWTAVFAKCKQIRIERFAAALYRIAEKHLSFPVPEVFAAVETDERDLLEDILSGGDLGTGDIDRMHSASITLDAVSSGRRGKKLGGVLAAAFPKRDSLTGRYPYLKKRPWLLPAAWGHRLAKYLLHRDSLPKGKPGRSLRIGSERVKLLKEYGIID